MLKTKLSLDVLAKELKELPTERQFKIKGGYFGSPIVLPPVTIIDTPLDDDTPDPGDNPYNNDDPSDSMGGSYGGSFDDSGNDDDNVKDPDGLLASLKSSLQEAVAMLSNLPAGGPLSAEYVQDKIDEYNKILETIDKMESSDYTFKVFEGAGDSHGETSKDPETGEIWVRVDDANDIGLLVHELTHVEQFLNGDYTFDETGQPEGFTLEMEIEAFQAQYEYFAGPRAGEVDWDGNPSPGWEVTEEWLLERFPEYQDLENSGGDGAGSSEMGSSGN